MSLGIWATVTACEHCGRGEESVFDFNITHNVSPMWRLAGCDDALYESDGKRCSEVLPTILVAVDHMEAHPDRYRPLNPPNGWGDYDGALRFLRDLAEAMGRYPNAKIAVSR